MDQVSQVEVGWLPVCPSGARLTSPRHPAMRLAIVQQWVEKTGLDPTAYGTRSMRRTEPPTIYRRAKNLRAVPLLLGHIRRPR